MEGAFCAKCGTSIGAGAPPPPPGPAQGYAPPPPNYGPGPTPAAAQAGGGLTDNVAGALCYILGILTGIIFLVLAPYNQNRLIRFHAFQSIFFGIGIFVCWIALLVFSIALHVIPIIGSIISLLLYLCFSLGIFICYLMLMYKAYNNEKWMLPVIGALADKQA
ncbi:MAG: hypothetical protein ABI165_18370 [Bryobacteraceae bacterium]